METAYGVYCNTCGDSIDYADMANHPCPARVKHEAELRRATQPILNARLLIGEDPRR